jgi:dUTP pyrophosphatase
MEEPEEREAEPGNRRKETAEERPAEGNKSASPTRQNHRTLRVLLSREPHGMGLPLPRYASAGAAGMDLYAALPAGEEVTLAAGQRALIPTGIRLGLPSGYEGQVRGRSGLAARYGIGLVNAPGTIDCDYTGEVRVIVINWGEETYTVRRGDRIAQLVIAPVVRAHLVEVETLGATERGDAGFGSTGFQDAGE